MLQILLGDGTCPKADTTTEKAKNTTKDVTRVQETRGTSIPIMSTKSFISETVDPLDGYKPRDVCIQYHGKSL